jgi:hypothetical protein
MFAMLIAEELKEENWTINRLKALAADMPPQKWHENFCPVCKRHHMKHNDKRCSMRFVEEV